MPLPLLALLPLLAGSAAGLAAVTRTLQERGQGPPSLESLFFPGAGGAASAGRSSVTRATANKPTRSRGQGGYNSRVINRIKNDAQLASNRVGLSGYPSYNAEDLLAGSGLTPAILEDMMNRQLNGNPYANYMGQPRDMSQDWLSRVGAIYDPQIEYAKSVIPYLEQQGANAQGEVTDLYNIAEQTYNDTAGKVRSDTASAAAAQRDAISQLIGEYGAGQGEVNADYLAEVANLGLGSDAPDQAQQVSQEYQGTMAREGAYMNNAMAEQGSSTADMLATIGSLQDAYAAGAVKDLANQVAGRIFEQQGKITGLMGDKSAAELDMIMRARADYLSQLEMAVSGQQQSFENILSLAELRNNAQRQAYEFNMGDMDMYLKGQQVLGGSNGAVNEPSAGQYTQWAVDNASGGNPTIKTLLVRNTGAVMTSLLAKDYAGAVAYLEKQGVPSANATAYVSTLAEKYL